MHWRRKIFPLWLFCSHISPSTWSSLWEHIFSTEYNVTPEFFILTKSSTAAVRSAAWSSSSGCFHCQMQLLVSSCTFVTTATTRRIHLRVMCFQMFQLSSVIFKGCYLTIGFVCFSIHLVHLNDPLFVCALFRQLHRSVDLQIKADISSEDAGRNRNPFIIEYSKWKQAVW